MFMLHSVLKILPYLYVSLIIIISDTLYRVYTTQNNRASPARHGTARLELPM